MQERKLSLAIYAGPGSPTPLVDLARIRGFELHSSAIITAALSTPVWSNQESFALEAEGSLAKHLERLDAFSFGGALVVRWLKTPWSAGNRRARSTFAFGNGLSYATSIPDLESRLVRTSNLLYHLFLEVTYSPDDQSPWEGLFRIHHRSGAFGLFNQVVGGSDYLCLGLRYRIN